MALPTRRRDEQRAASEAAILDAAWDLFARSGPDGTSMRAVGAAAGCTHALVVRYHGSKDELVDVVASRLGARVDRVVGHAVASADEPLLEVLTAARAHRTGTQLLVRTALGDLPPRGFPACLHVEWLLSQAGPQTSGAEPDRRARLCAYAAASLLLGFVTFEDFVITATGLGLLPGRRRDVAMAGAARRLLDLARTSEPPLVARGPAATSTAVTSPDQRPSTGRDALVGSAVVLFAEHGPATISVRDVARHARANQGLIYRHFGSKDALLAEAIEQGVSDLFPAALAAGGFDFDAMSWLLHHGSPGPRLLARTLLDGVPVTAVRRRFPVLRRLLDAYDRVPTGAGPGDLSDPRVAVAATAAMALGSAIWGGHLRGPLGLGAGDGIEAAVADLARALVSGAPPPKPRRRAGPVRG